MSGAGTLSVSTVQTRRNIVSMHPQIISMVPLPFGESTQPSRTSVLLLADIKYVEEQKAERFD